MEMEQAKASKIAGWPRNRVAGFSLIELMVTIAIFGILTSLAMPSFSGFVAGQRIKTASFDMMSMLMFARSEAIKRNDNVTLSGIGGNLLVTAGGVTLQQHETFSGVTLTCKTAGAAAPCTNVVYTGSGRLQATPPSVEISSTSSSQVRCISIDLSGRPTSKKVACS